jgi:hypothetical protein
LILMLTLLGCHRHEGAPPVGGETGSPVGNTPTDSGGDPPDQGSGCLDTGLCSVDIATATWDAGPKYSWSGYRLQPGNLSGTATLIVGSPLGRRDHNPSEAALLDPTNLEEMGRWLDTDPKGDGGSSSFGESVAFSPDGSRIAIGASDGAETCCQDGTVYAFEALPQGDTDVVDAAVMTLYGDASPHFSLGVGLGYLDFTGDGIDLVVGSGNADPGTPNDIYRFDAALTGSHGVEAALASISGEPIFGQQVAGWDGDGDGLDELVTSIEEGAAHFDTPWVGDLTQADADVRLVESDPLDQLGSTILDMGDLDGDGAPELAITADTYYGAGVARGGGLWLENTLPAADVLGSDLPFAFVGTQVGEAMGSGVASGDWDGDGVRDIAVGAAGYLPGELTGKVCGYLGPLSPGTKTAADADFVVHGEDTYDAFGVELANIEAEDGGPDDLAVSAFQWNDRGRVYLFHGADLTP